MKITKSQLRKIIKEELESTLSELTAKPEGYKSIGHFPEEIGGSRMPRIYAPPDYQQMMQYNKLIVLSVHLINHSHISY